MNEPWRGQGQGTHYLVLNRSCADLYDQIVALFAERLDIDIEVVVDRRRGKGGMATIPSPERPHVPMRQGRPANVQQLSARLRKEA